MIRPHPECECADDRSVRESVRALASLSWSVRPLLPLGAALPHRPRSSTSGSISGAAVVAGVLDSAC